MKKPFVAVTITTSLLSVLLALGTQLFNLPPAVSGSGFMVLLVASYAFTERQSNFYTMLAIHFVLMVATIVAGALTYGENFLWPGWLAQTLAFMCTATLLYYLIQRANDLDAAKVSQERLELVIEGMTAGHWDWDIKTNKRWWSDRHFELLGYKPGEVRPSDETLRNLIHPDDVERAYTVMDDYLHKQSKFELEVRYKTKAGDYKWFLATGQSKFNEKGEPVRMVGSIIDIDEKKKSQELIARQAALIQILPHAVAFGTTPQQVLSLNKAAEQMFEISSDEARGKQLDELVKIDVIGATRDDVRSQLWGPKGFWVGESVFTTPSGKKMAVLATLKALPGDNGLITDWVGIYTDITALKTVEERLGTALNGMSAGLWEWDIVKNKRWWSPRYFEVLGFKEGDIVPSAETLKNLCHPDDQPKLFSILEEYMHKRGSFELEIRYKTKFEGYKWFRSHGQTIFDESGQPLRMVGTLINIDEKRKAKSIIEQQAMLLNMMPDGIVYGSYDRKVLRINATAAKMFAIQPEEIIGKNFDDFITVNLINSERESIKVELMQNGFWRGESEIVNAKGGKFRALINIIRADDMEGGKPGWIAIYTDLSMLQRNQELRDSFKGPDEK